ncbi:MAG: ATP-binding protein [Anaerolineae bacterium]
MSLFYSLSAVLALGALAGLGVLVVERQRSRWANRLLGGFLLTVAGYLVSSLAFRWLASGPATWPFTGLAVRDIGAWAQAAHALSILFASVFPSLILHFALEFPRPRLYTQGGRVYLLYLPGLLLFLLGMVGGLMAYPAAPDGFAALWYGVWRLWVIAYFGLSLTVLLRSYRRASGRVERQQLALVLMGLGAPFLSLPLGWASAAWERSGWSHVAWMFTAVLLAYGIARYQLLDVRVVIRRALVYSLLTVLVMAGYVGAALALSLLTAGLPDALERGLNAMLIVLIAMLVAPTKDRLQATVDRVFFPGEAGREDLLHRLSRDLHAELSEEGVALRTLHCLIETLNAGVAYLLVEQDGIFAPVHHAGRVPPRALEQRFAAEDDLIRCLARHQQAVTVDQMHIDPRFGAAYVRSWARLDAMDAALCVPLSDSEGALVGVVLVGRKRTRGSYGPDDIRFAQGVCNQAAVALENARLHRRASEAERLAALGRMASAILHDLRTPIGGMMRCVEALGQDELPADARNRLAMSTLEMMTRLYHMAQQILDYSRGGWTLEMKKVPLGEFVRGLLPVIQADVQEHGIEVRLDLAYEGEVIMDPTRMSQVIYNLVSNARDAMPDGGVLTLGSRASDGEVFLTVADTGVGIPPERLQRIFEPFVSYKSDRGAGLGLAISSKIVADHGGCIRVQSEVGVGSTFTVVLPRRPAAPGDGSTERDGPIRE